MPKRIIGACLAAALAVSLMSCSTGRPSTPARPAAAPESVEHAVARLLGNGALISTVDTRTIPGRSPLSFLEVHTDTTPTAGSMLGVLSAMVEQDSGQGRYMALRVTLPEHPGSEPLVVALRWNPTAATVPPEGARAPMPPRSLWLTLGHGSDGIASSPKDTNMIASEVTTEAIAEAANGQGPLMQRLRDQAGLP